MIPYEELVHALQQWRARQGMGVSPSRTGRASAPVAVPAPAAPYVPAAPPPARASAAFPAAPAAAAAALSSRPPPDDFESADGTEIRDGMDDEIDVDAEAVDVIDEQIEDE